jgi:hypothetical protein
MDPVTDWQNEFRGMRGHPGDKRRWVAGSAIDSALSYLNGAPQGNLDNRMKLMIRELKTVSNEDEWAILTRHSVPCQTLPCCLVTEARAMMLKLNVLSGKKISFLVSHTQYTQQNIQPAPGGFVDHSKTVNAQNAFGGGLSEWKQNYPPDGGALPQNGTDPSAESIKRVIPCYNNYKGMQLPPGDEGKPNSERCD